MTASLEGTRPRVLAVVVANDGRAWLPEALRCLDAQTYPELAVLAVDNGSRDGSRELLIERLGEDAVLIAERDLGFPAAIAMAADTTAAAEADLLLFLHDDCALEPGAVETLVDAMLADPRLAIVGCKLVRWDDPARLDSVGASVDVTGRTDTGLEPDELDQGQRDVGRPVLYVSTSGMLVRRELFDRLGRFDRRYHLFRDDLDLCWRAWLAGHDVEVVPDAVARHASSATNYDRLGQTAALGPRYFAERNTLATLLKNYGTGRLLAVLPLFLVVGIAKVVGFVATRRLSDAWQTVRAWLWNVLHLRETLRLRRSVQAQRSRTDGELRHLFARVAPRLRAYGEEIAYWLTGGDTDVASLPAPDELGEPELATRRFVRAIRARPVITAGIVLGVAGLVLAIPLLGAGELRGGELAPWPASPSAFFEAYVSSFHDVGGVGTAEPPSPAQAVLGIVQVLTFGNEWLASRLLVLGALPLAWLLSLRAAAVVTSQRLPRLVAATAYALSPPLLAALRTGRVSALVLAVAVPALVIATSTMLDRSATPNAAWRATAAAALIAAGAVAFVPVSAAVLVGGGLVALVTLLLREPDRDRRRGAAVRLAGGLAGTFLLLFPWSLDLVLDGGLFTAAGLPPGASSQPFWRWLMLSPSATGFASVFAGAGFVIAGLLAIALGSRHRPLAVAGLWAVALGGATLAFFLGRMGVEAITWPGVALIPAAAAFAGLLAVAFSEAGSSLEAHAFGWRQVLAGTTVAAVFAAMLASAVTMLDEPWGAYVVDDPVLPAFIGSDVTDVGPYRVLVLADVSDTIAWDLTDARGPTMARFGQEMPAALVALVDDGLADVLGGADPGAAGRLGLANVRYVVVPDGGRSPELDRVLEDQLDLQPQPVNRGRVFRVSGWLPRASYVPVEAVDPVTRLGEVPAGAGIRPLESVGDDRWTGNAPRPGSLLVAEVSGEGWQATADGVRLEPREVAGLVRFDLAEPAERVEVGHAAQVTRTVLVSIQAMIVLLAFSLMLRPPSFAETLR